MKYPIIRLFVSFVLGGVSVVGITLHFADSRYASKSEHQMLNRQVADLEFAPLKSRPAVSTLSSEAKFVDPDLLLPEATYTNGVRVKVVQWDEKRIKLVTNKKLAMGLVSTYDSTFPEYNIENLIPGVTQKVLSQLRSVAGVSGEVYISEYEVTLDVEGLFNIKDVASNAALALVKRFNTPRPIAAPKLVTPTTFHGNE